MFQLSAPDPAQFWAALSDLRDKDLKVQRKLIPPRFVHHDLDAPPWWHFRKKERLYLDGFAEKAHRPLMQFALDGTALGEIAVGFAMAFVSAVLVVRRSSGR